MSALELLRDFAFLAPPERDKWAETEKQLNQWLATPAQENLAAARLLLRQLAEGVDLKDIKQALVGCHAQIDANPELPAHNEKVRLAIRFRDIRLNSATARRSVACEWEFLSKGRPTRARPSRATEGPGLLYWKKIYAALFKKYDPNCLMPAEHERGWEIYRYFETNVQECEILVRFYVSGEPLGSATEATGPLIYRKTITPRSGVRAQRDKWERYRALAPEALQLGASLAVPLATLAVTTAGQAASGRWWTLVGIGFGSETIRAILTGAPSQSVPPAVQK
ncbi:MAG: hypothetical protein JO061_08960 [Acidobacteriaceae bacterium]|nr:hypothetical protein [Acidobacteriaceae bacterium]